MAQADDKVRTIDARVQRLRDRVHECKRHTPAQEREMLNVMLGILDLLEDTL